MADVSCNDVRIMVEEPHAVAREYSLLFRCDANPGRRCRVKWRNGREIGAKFF